MMDFIFGKKKTPQELMRQYKRQIDRTVRELDRERVKMQQQEKKLIAEMKKLAKDGQIDAVKIMAKDIVRTRSYVTKFYKMRAQLQAVGLRLQTLRSTAEMTKAMSGVTRVMVGMNQRMNIPAMQKVMAEFAKQSDLMDQKEEFIGDTIDDIMEGEDEEEEEEQLVNSVLDEIGLDLSGQIPVHQKAIKQPVQALQEEDSLQARLDNLRRD